VAEIAFRIFGKYYAKRRHKYESLRRDLLAARIFVPVEKWLSSALFTSIVSSPISAIAYLSIKLILSVSGSLLETFRNLPDYFQEWQYRITHLQDYLGNLSPSVISQTISMLVSGLKVELTILDLLIVVTLMTAVPLSVYYLYRLYPKFKAWERGRKIDGKLPYAIAYISPMASVGVTPYEIFKRLSKLEDIYGEVSVEVKRLVRDVELMGYDFLNALRNLAATTPSKNLSTFLTGAVITSLTGGEMRDYFINKAGEYFRELRKKYEDFISSLAVITEIYLVALVAAPLFLIIVYTTMLMMGGASPIILFLIVYCMIPIGSLLFMLLIDTITPEGAR